MTARSTLVLLSGGMDSTSLAAELLHSGRDVAAIGFDYGQRHNRELDAAHQVAQALGIQFTVIDVRDLGRVLRSALTSPDIPVPHGHYAAESMRATVVPNRNAIMLMIAAGAAASAGIGTVATAVHAGDHPVYQDCRPEFVTAIDAAAQAACGVRVIAPFVAVDKAEIARRGTAAGAPLHLTWSCYEGGVAHCGRCGTCVERQEAFQLAGIPDPTTYRSTAA